MPGLISPNMHVALNQHVEAATELAYSIADTNSDVVSAPGGLGGPQW